MIVLLSPGDLIPDADRASLIGIGEAMSNCQWTVGKYTCRYLAQYDRHEQNATAELRFGRMAIYGYIAGLTGKSTRSVRRYAWATEFYQNQPGGLDGALTQFTPLSFEHYAHAAAYGQLWAECLAAALREMDRRGGTPPPADWIDAYASPNVVTAAEIPDPPESERPAPDGDPSEYTGVVTEPRAMTPVAVDAAGKVVNVCLDRIMKTVAMLPLEGDILTRFIAAWDQVRAATDEIYQSLIEQTKTR